MARLNRSAARQRGWQPLWHMRHELQAWTHQKPGSELGSGCTSRTRPHTGTRCRLFDTPPVLRCEIARGRTLPCGRMHLQHRSVWRRSFTVYQIRRRSSGACSPPRLPSRFYATPPQAQVPWLLRERKRHALPRQWFPDTLRSQHAIPALLHPILCHHLVCAAASQHQWRTQWTGQSSFSCGT